jgi:phosphoribosylformylglycinamidine synthase I
MKRQDIKVLLMRAPGTNCDLEALRAFKDLGVQAEIVQSQKIFKTKNLEDYSILFLPGGFSYGDYVRSGAIWAKEMEYRIGKELKEFVEHGRSVIGVCNGFQVLVETGFLPGFSGKSTEPEAALGNSTHGYQCRWIRMKKVNRGNCQMLNNIEEGTILQTPIAHGEGRFILPPDKLIQLLRKLYDNDQVVFKYCREDGSPAGGEWPINPNGALDDVAGICNPEGNVLGLMPHPERAYYGHLMPFWTNTGLKKYGDGFPFFESIIKYTEKKF